MMRSEMTYKVAMWIDKVGFPIIVPLGLLGNSLSIAVLSQKQNKAISSNIYLISLAMSDSSNLVSISSNVCLITLSMSIYVITTWKLTFPTVHVQCYKIDTSPTDLPHKILPYNKNSLLTYILSEQQSCTKVEKLVLTLKIKIYFFDYYFLQHLHNNLTTLTWKNTSEVHKDLVFFHWCFFTASIPHSVPFLYAL